ncbi:MAG: 16S rRNA (adenine(1518)-N(6)/adenine(1519)-N(6))-dimethyltransferase RsmA, partial [Patescibacteria group bacterium]
MKAKKYFGQYFLNSSKALEEIISGARLESSDVVLEIGPGRGVLTLKLLSQAKKVVAVEKDRELIELLKVTFSKDIESGKMILVEEDILDFVPENFGLHAGKYKLVANIPYYITGEILRKFIGGKTSPSLAVLLVQKEVADRITEKDLKGSILSVSIKVYGTPERLSLVKKGSFSPQPNVDSAVLLIDNISKSFFNTFSEEDFFLIVKRGFSQKRKQLKNNFDEHFEENLVSKAFSTCAIPVKARAEE